MFVSLFPEKVVFSREKVVFTILKVTFSDERVTFSRLKVILLHINMRIRLRKNDYSFTMREPSGCCSIWTRTASSGSSSSMSSGHSMKQRAPL